ncbi:MAG: hypothetical protein ABJN26_07285 [Stappiaceae bacterium]
MIFAFAAAGVMMMQSWFGSGTILGHNSIQYRANVDTAYAHLMNHSSKRLR